ncbi:MAG: DUF4433 domain-containing protein [Chloroflexi bacterium]|nr:DUF4433 domain-containing protein [Chloroflexota bacterium]
MKPWHADIKEHIEEWSARLGNRSWWPQFVYHFTDVRNAALILQSGELLSRREAQRAGVMAVDNASPEVIQQTYPEHFQYVRMYFRPRTPTQYNNEGIRPISKRTLGGAHCPVPIYFCFSAFEVLTRDDALFSNGNIGSYKATISQEREFFRAIPFQWVFHSGAFTSDKRDEIIFRRNAEVLVPNRLALSPSLKFIACRSAAERQTLLHLLPTRSRQKWDKLIRIDSQGLYERRWTFVEEVVTVSDSRRVVIRLNPGITINGPFHVRFEYREHDNSAQFLRERDFEGLPAIVQVNVSEAVYGEAKLWLDDSLAFQDIINFSDIPL